MNVYRNILAMKSVVAGFVSRRSRFSGYEVQLQATVGNVMRCCHAIRLRLWV